MTTTTAAAAITTVNTTAVVLPMNYSTINPTSILLDWLVNHPMILNFSWSEGQTLGSSPRFLTFTVLSYLSLTFFLSQNPFFSLESHLRRRITALHNFILIVISFTMAIGCTLSTLSQSPDVHYIICFPTNTKPKGPIFFWAYMFYLSKIYEYIDTLLILMNNKSISRLSFLHVYHHATVVIMCYLGLHTTQSSLPLVIVTNCLVHVFMYSYYLLCALGFRPKWKKLVTDCQILQFLSSFVIFSLIFGYHFGTNSGCSGIWGCVFSAGFVITLLYLFLDFHSKSYSAVTNKLKLQDKEM
ncbi:elongation of fatty acids protein 3-like [Melia azedarach]|uniref:Elongation of fatty acids protein 3-like n=1 Tax=Melia azedarach TaxID=155640 RepID=A0ACC1Y0W5_MELAZ|nr:elongation of fatty acids protein 3-like [Melia azedarach]